MNPDNHNEYFRLKAEINTLGNKVADVTQRIGNSENQLMDLKTSIQSITNVLEKEDMAIAANSRIRPMTLTIDQYKAHKSELEEITGKLAALEQVIAYDNKELYRLQSELSLKRSSFASVRGLILGELIEKSIDEVKEVVEAAAESFRKLAMSIIAAEGIKNRGFQGFQREDFNSVSAWLIFDEIVPVLFADTKEFPGMDESNEYVNALIEGAA